MAKKKKDRAESSTAAATGEARPVDVGGGAGAPVVGAGPAAAVGGLVPEPLERGGGAEGAAPGKVEPKLHVEHHLGPDPILEATTSGLERLRENWQLLAAGVLVLVVAVLFITWRVDSAKARNRLAWEELKNAITAAGQKPPPPDRLQELLERYRGTAAEPFIELKIADAYALEGKRDSTEKALEIYKRVLDQHGTNELARFLAKSSIDGAARSLAFDPKKFAAEKGGKLEWAKGEEPKSASPSK